MISGSKANLGRLALTVIFNTLIAVVLAYMVLDKEDFRDVFMISQFIGLSICLFVSIAMNKAHRQNRTRTTTAMIAGLFMGIASGSFLSWGYLALRHQIELYYFMRNVASYVVVFGVVFGVPIIYFFVAREKISESEKLIHQEKIKRLTMEKEAAMTGLRLLQAQIEPHFLFNTLSNVISLLDIDPGKAKKMLMDLNEFLRISIQRTRQEMVSLAQELNLVRQYLEIFKIRMGDRLSYEIRDNTPDDDLPFPPLIIQPLVENCIKYGIEPAISGGTITIEAEVNQQMLIVVVADTGRGLDEDADRAGIGINNVSKRLESIYGSRAQLFLKQNRPTGLKAVIKVPL